MDDLSISILIPTDDDRFVLLRCHKCGEYFKLLSDDVQSEKVLNIHCPQCGLISENYITDDVIELAQAKTINHLFDGFYSEMKKCKRKNCNSFIKMKASKPEKEEEISIRLTIDSMEVVVFECCDCQAKIRHLLNYCGCYCPYCGGQKDGSN